MSRLIRLTVAGAIAAAAFAPAAVSAAAPCEVTFESRYVGGPNWTAVVMYPVVNCG